jgi:hypothetical protein
MFSNNSSNDGLESFLNTIFEGFNMFILQVFGFQFHVGFSHVFHSEIFRWKLLRNFL